MDHLELMVGNRSKVNLRQGIKTMETSLKETCIAERRESVRLLLNYFDTVTRVIRGKGNDQDQKFTEQDVLRGDKNILTQEIEQEIKEFYVYVLNLLECGLSEHPDLFKQIRPRILRGGNDAIRNLTKNLDNYFTIKLRDQETIKYQGEEKWSQ